MDNVVTLRKRTTAYLGLVLVAIALTGIVVLLGHTSVAQAGPPCTSHALATGCTDQGYDRQVQCIGNLRFGPSTGYAVHGTASGIFRVYLVDNNGGNVTAQCNHTFSSSAWILSNNGWVSLEILF